MELNRGFGWHASWWPETVQPYTAHYGEFGFTPAGYEVNFLYGGDEYSGAPPLFTFLSLKQRLGFPRCTVL